LSGLGWGRSREYGDTEATVFHLAAVALETDGTGGWHGQGGFEDFAVTGAMGEIIGDDDLDLIPILGPVMLEGLVGAGEEVVSALELRFSDEDAAVGVGGGTEFQAEDEVVGEGLKCAQALDFSAFGRGGYDEPTMPGDVAAIGGGGEAVEVYGCGYDGPGGGIGGVGGFPAAGGFDVLG